ncbi:MAG: nuclease-related domain-containing protein, partial [Actinomycetota bacterium]
MIEGGKAGASALALAAQRRAEVERLVVEAQHYEAVAADERIMAAQLATLPPIFVILHDLKVPDSPETADHVVVGPGGAFLIVTRRCLDSVEFRDGELWSGGRSLKSEIDGARVISALLTRTLVTPVVPVVGFVGAGVPIGTPTVVQGVIVCAADGVARVVTRATHTHLLAHEFAQVVQRAVPLL